jgi:hypothetical protein
MLFQRGVKILQRKISLEKGEAVKNSFSPFDKARRTDLKFLPFVRRGKER